MTRSYKKNPIIKDYNKGMKAAANRKVRRILKQKRTLELANGNAYRKLFNPWDISDWRFRETWLEYQKRADQYKKEFENGVFRWGYRRIEDWSEDMNFWKWFRMYKRK